MCDILDVPGYLVTMDNEKAFDSLDYDFVSVLKKFGLLHKFHLLDKIKWRIYNSIF